MSSSDKISVLYLSDASYFGGAEKYLFLLASALDRERYVASALVSSESGADKLAEMLRDEGLQVERMDFGSPFSPRVWRALSKVLKAARADILHMNIPGPFDSLYGLPAVLAGSAGIKQVVSTEHLPMFPTFTKARLIRSLTNRYVDRVITVSEDNRKYLSGIHGVAPEKIEVIYNGIPDPGELSAPDLFENDGGGAVRILLVAGSLEKRKGQMTAIRAMKALPEDVALALAGEGPMEEEYRRAVEDMGLSERVRFLGYRDDIPSLIKGADILLVPSEIEATPYVILEAMAAGVPVVASSVYGIPELVEDGRTGLLVKPGDDAEMASAVEMILQGEELRRSMSKESRKRYEAGFTIEKCAERTMKVYGDLIRKAGGS